MCVWQKPREKRDSCAVKRFDVARDRFQIEATQMRKKCLSNCFTNFLFFIWQWEEKKYYDLFQSIIRASDWIDA